MEPATSVTRLSAAALGRATGAEVPRYDRSPVPTIVHIGVGAFARAHLGVYADDLLRQGWPATIRGVSLRGSRAEEQLGPQDGLYTVASVDPPGDLRVVGAITSVATGPRAAVEAIAAPSTALVTLTVTEKGYDGVGEPSSAPAVVALGLARRWRDGLPPPIVASLDNVLDNGRVLGERVGEVAERDDPLLRSWIRERVSFPTSVVDRMVPATTDADIEDIRWRLGLLDLGAVVAEQHRSWVIEAVDGLPPLADVGVEVVEDVDPFQRRKLWLLNGPHSALAYCGLVAGCDTIADAAVHPRVSPFVDGLVADILDAADLPGTDTAFAKDALRRFQNPSLGHTCVQVGADGSRKLPQRLVPVVVARRQRRLGTDRFALVVAAWIAAATGVPVRGQPLPAVDDPSAEGVRNAMVARDLRLAAALAPGGDDRTFASEVADALARLLEDGIDALGRPL